MRISPRVGIRKITMDPRSRPEVIHTFPVGTFRIFRRPVTESVTARAGSDTDFPSGKHSEFFDRPAGSDTDFPNGNDSEFFGRPVTESVTARAGSGTDFPSGNIQNFSVDRSRSR